MREREWKEKEREGDREGKGEGREEREKKMIVGERERVCVGRRGGDRGDNGRRESEMKVSGEWETKSKW